jgi:hypothetical protein
MHDPELLRRAQYDQDNDPLDNLYVISAAHAPTASPGAVNNFPAFSRWLRTIRYPKDFKPAIEKYNGRSDPSIWLKMYSIAARASGGNKDYMAGYFPLVMGKAPLLWLDNLQHSVSPPRPLCLAYSRPTTRRPTIVLAILTTSLEYG